MTDVLKLNIQIERRQDGPAAYFRITSGDVPGLHLGGHELVPILHDLGPVLRDLLWENRKILL